MTSSRSNGCGCITKSFRGLMSEELIELAAAQPRADHPLQRLCAYAQDERYRCTVDVSNDGKLWGFVDEIGNVYLRSFYDQHYSLSDTVRALNALSKTFVAPLANARRVHENEELSLLLATLEVQQLYDAIPRLRQGTPLLTLLSENPDDQLPPRPLPRAA